MTAGGVGPPPVGYQLAVCLKPLRQEESIENSMMSGQGDNVSVAT